MTNHDAIIPEGVLLDTGLAARIKKTMENNRPKAALGNMKTHLYLDDPTKLWVSVGRSDLEKVLEYIATLESKQAILLKNFEESSSQ
jgi:hypothetical protein